MNPAFLSNSVVGLLVRFCLEAVDGNRFTVVAAIGHVFSWLCFTALASALYARSFEGRVPDLVMHDPNADMLDW